MNIRKADDSDKPRIAEFIEKDEFHKEAADEYRKRTDKPPEEYFFEDGSECMAVEDGDTVFYIRQVKALRLNAVFDGHTRKENAVLLRKFTNWLAHAAQAAGFRELIFATDSPDLAHFAQSDHLKFQESPKDLVRSLAPIERTEVANL